MLRIVTFANVLAFLPRGRQIEGFARLPPEFRDPPAGLGWVAPNLPITERLVRWSTRGLVVTSTMAAVGFCTPVAVTGAVICAMYVGAVPWYYAHHGHKQHLLWFAAIVAASPGASDALSVDAFLRRRRRGQIDWAPSPAYGLPVKLTWVVLGSLYLVPGIGKVMSGGARWVFSDNLRNRVWTQWHRDDYDAPRVLRRVVNIGWFMRSGALGTVLFELGFVFAVGTRRGRRLLGAASWLFHVGVYVLMGIDFLSMATIHIGLLERDASRPQFPRRGREVVRPMSLAPALVAGMIVAANHALPLTGRDNAYGWPFTIYPVFLGVAPATQTVVSAELHRTGQEPEALDLVQLLRDGGLEPGVASFVQETTLNAPETERLNRFSALLRLVGSRVELREGDEIVFSSDRVTVDPERLDDPPLSSTELLRLKIDSTSATASTADPVRLEINS
jgi:hypothetical protein